VHRKRHLSQAKFGTPATTTDVKKWRLVVVFKSSPTKDWTKHRNVTDRHGQTDKQTDRILWLLQRSALRKRGKGQVRTFKKVIKW